MRDDQWERIKEFLPGREGHVGIAAKDNRLFVEAVLYRYRAGIPWRDLPEWAGVMGLSWNTIAPGHVGLLSGRNIVLSSRAEEFRAFARECLEMAGGQPCGASAEAN